MRLPDFLVIGAMKSGTTSLYFDLQANPAIFLPEDKEPTHLADDEVLGAAGRRAYARLFRGAARHQVCGEASTGYSKLPDIPGVPQRARRLIGQELKVIYLVREPVARTVSHHYHEVTAGNLRGDVDSAVRSEPRLIDYSRYAMQIRPWVKTFGERRVLVVRFEDYVADRVAHTASICRFLGVEPNPAGIATDRIHNRGEDARVPRGPFWRFSRSDLYRSLIRPWLARPVRRAIRGVLTPPAPPRPPPPSLSTVDYILERVRDDVDELAAIIGATAPLWDLDTVRSRYDIGSSKH